MAFMPFPKKLLNDYETVALDLHPHWWYFAEPAGAVLGAIALGILAKARLEGDPESVLGVVALVLIVGCVVWLVARYVKWANTNFVITSDRLIFRYGVIGKNGIEIPLERVNNVNFSQSIFERFVGAGDLVIESGGEDGAVEVHRHPQARAGQEPDPLPDGGERAAPRWVLSIVRPVPAVDVASQLEKLEGLLHRGSLSREEFDAQKRKLLGDVGPISGARSVEPGSTDVTTKLPPPPPPGANR